MLKEYSAFIVKGEERESIIIFYNYCLPFETILHRACLKFFLFAYDYSINEISDFHHWKHRVISFDLIFFFLFYNYTFFLFTLVPSILPSVNCSNVDGFPYLKWTVSSWIIHLLFFIKILFIYFYLKRRLRWHLA